MMLCLATLFSCLIPISQHSAIGADTNPPPAAESYNDLRAESPRTSAAAARWLVHLAMHQGHVVGRHDARAASLHVMALLRGAVHVDADCEEAHFWLYDIEQRMGRMDEARQALENYVRLVPTDATARIRLLEMKLEACQTGEDRAQLVRSELEGTALPGPYKSELHYQLAMYHHQRREVGFATKQIEAALLANPLNIPARQLAFEVFGETEPALQRVELALQLISSNPSQANLVWDLAEFLDRLSMHTAAQEWYNRAIDIHRQSGSGPVPAEFWHKLAVSYASSHDYENAVRAATEALTVQESLHIARLLRSHALQKLGRKEEADADVEFVAKAYRSRVPEAVENHAYDLAAEIAWFYCYHRPEPALALQMSEIAMSDPTPSSLAKVAHGFALRLNGRRDEAIAILKPQAEVDQLAAYELGKTLIDSGDKQSARTVLQKAAAIQYSGIAFEMIREQLRELGETPPQPPAHSAVAAALDKFKRDVFDYYRRPWDFLQFSIRGDAQASTTGPIEVTLRIENIGPFPISFGEGFMARPLVAISARLGTEPPEAFENYMQALLNTTPMLLPGESAEKTICLDVGELRMRLIQQATREIPIEITAVFDPVFKDGQLTAGLGSISAMPVTIVRAAIDTSTEGLNAIFAAARSQDVDERLMAADWAGALVATAAADPQAHIDSATIERCNATVAELMSDVSWCVRARALVAAGWAPLDPRVTMAAAPHVRKDNPITRMLAVRLFAEQHGAKFRKVVETYSRTDRTDYVRLMAASFLPAASRVSMDDSGAEN